VLALILAGSGTALATGLGAIPVFFLGQRAASLRALLWGLAAGVMTVASLLGLLAPALDEGSAAAVAAGAAAGILFLLAARNRLDSHEATVGSLRGADVTTSILVFSVLFVHSLPEGLALGAAYASNTEGLALFVILAIALQNIPEGTSVAIPMQAAGFSRSQQFWAAVGTSLPQPVGAVVAYLAVETVDSLLPVSLAFAGGAMLALVAVEMLPQSVRAGGWRSTAAGGAAGGLVMLALALALGV
jgi:zinc transporter, ZIP family